MTRIRAFISQVAVSSATQPTTNERSNIAELIAQAESAVAGLGNSSLNGVEAAVEQIKKRLIEGQSLSADLERAISTVEKTREEIGAATERFRSALDSQPLDSLKKR